ncbi:hypothetical protein HYX00_05980 [Candidatus Woesearchaeota archaeon]|nr:hypothetical protein [Candidatus Woesearchaeota archaeon]
MRAISVFILLFIVLIVGCSTVEKSDNSASKEMAKSVQEKTTQLNKNVTEKQEIVKCNGITDKKTLDSCYIRKSVKEKDDKICLKISDEFSKDVCYMQLAAWYNLPKYCDGVVIPKEKDLCFFGLAIQLSDLALCDKIRKDTEINTDQNVCKKAAAIKNTKENIRNESLLDDDQILDIVYTTSDSIDRVLIEEMNKKTGSASITTNIKVPTKISSEEDASMWVTYYYIKPNPALTVDAIKAIVKSKNYDPEDISGASVSFFGEIFKENDGKLSEWMNQLDSLNDEQKVLVWQSLWFADTSKSKSILKNEKNSASALFKNYIDTLLEQEPPNILKDDVLSGYQLDMLWGLFFKTGNEEPINKIISVLPWSEEYKKEYDKRVADYQSGKAKEPTEAEALILVKYSVGAAAKWGLTSNSVQHDRVFEIAAKGIVNQKAVTKDILKEIVYEANKERISKS